MDIKDKIESIYDKNNGSKLKLNYYNNENNFGDMLNVLLLNKLFGLKVEYSEIKKAQAQCIGSMLDIAFFNPNISKLKFIRKYIESLFLKPLKIWGTGFIFDKKIEEIFPIRSLEIYAIRGELSLARLKFLALNDKCRINFMMDKVPLADPGLLASLVLPKLPEKQYDVGIIPHFIHQKNENIINLSKKYKNSIIINVFDEPFSVIEQIAQCECVISTSLHGLIVSDSFCIPNQWVYIGGLAGGDFKFFDYYSSFNLEILPVDLNNDGILDLDNIKSNYKITKEMVLKKQNLLLEAFPYK